MALLVSALGVRLCVCARCSHTVAVRPVIVLLVGFYRDIIGTDLFHGALMLGLAIPDGPPLVTALGENPG